jgi:phosphoglycolate phosphatase
MLMLRILLFDYDGVLIDSLEIFMHHFITACQIEGFVKIKDKTSFLQLFDKNLYESMLSLGMSLEVILRVGKQLRDGLIRDQSKLTIFPGIYDAIKQLGKHNTMMVVTSNESNIVESMLNSHGLTEFTNIYGSDKGGSKVNKIIKIKQQFPNHEFYYIGDTKGDIYEGRKAGVNTVAVTWGWHTKKELETLKPDYLVEAPEQLIDLIV